MQTKLIYEALYNMLKSANTTLLAQDYAKLSNFNYKIKNQVLKNAYLANKNKRPLCQDTGQVVVFLKIGQNIPLEGEFVYDVINKAVKDCYTDNFFRKSVVKDAVFDRSNTNTNTPCIIHTEFIREDKVSILVGIKGGGAENMTALKMMNPTASLNEIIDFAIECVKNAGENACPPMIAGIGVGGTAEVAALNAKYALFKGKKLDVEIDNVLETKIISSPTHIASMPVCVNLNCHSIRHREAVIENDKIKYFEEDYPIYDKELSFDAKKVKVDDTETLKNLKTGDEILLSGKIYTARDAAHKRLVDMIKKNEPLPINLKGAVIFYAGPCPCAPNEVIGPIGPTTSKRMDVFAPILYEKGVIATVGKGNRTIKGGNRLYLKAMGGVATLYQSCVKSAKIAAFKDLGTEAIYELEVVDMPLCVEII